MTISPYTPKGTRVRYSDEGRQRLRVKKPDIEGIIAAHSRNPNCIGVKWDGKNYSSLYHVDFLNLADQTTQ